MERSRQRRRCSFTDALMNMYDLHPPKPTFFKAWLSAGFIALPAALIVRYFFHAPWMDARHCHFGEPANRLHGQSARHRRLAGEVGDGRIPTALMVRDIDGPT